MGATLRVITQSESFSEVWPRLAAASGVELEVRDAASGAGAAERACGVLVAAGGREDQAAELLEALREAAPGVGVAVAGAETDYRLVAALMRAGADDYFALPADLGLLHAWIAERAERAQARAGTAALATEQRARFDFSRIVGASTRLREALERAARVIPRGSATVLVTGETGTGKDLLAQAIHYNGPRAAQPFVEVNCAALPPGLLEAEMFGYERGAFTDARAAKPGLFETAHGGTLFLDEVGDLAPEMQAKLLRVLEKKRVRRLGSVRDVDVDVRIIAATHVDLAARVREGRFREDLLYRLNVIPVVLPPLRERGGDVLLLAESFVDAFAREYDVPRARVGPEVRRVLLAHDWPGNVRELRNALERAVILGAGELHPEDLFPEGAPGAASLLSPPSPPPAGGAALPFPATMEQIERAAARAMVERCGGNKSRAAELLGLSRKKLYALLADGAGEPA